MISCYLIYSKMVKDDTEALEFYGQKRTTDGKGVTIPSQRRYVNYFSQLRNENLQYRTKSLQVCMTFEDGMVIVVRRAFNPSR